MYTRQQVLDWVNEQRKNVGVDPIDHFVPGEPSHLSYCVIALTFDEGNDSVMDTEVYPETRGDFGNIYVNQSDDPDFPWGHLDYIDDDNEEHKIALPLFVTEFTKDFDNGQLPDLIAE